MASITSIAAAKCSAAHGLSRSTFTPRVPHMSRTFALVPSSNASHRVFHVYAEDAGPRERRKEAFVEKQAAMDGRSPSDYVPDKPHLRDNEPTGQNWWSRQNEDESKIASNRAAELFNARRNVVSDLADRITGIATGQDGEEKGGSSSSKDEDDTTIVDKLKSGVQGIVDKVKGDKGDE